MKDEKSSTLERFIRWFVVPLKALKAIPDGDGAFMALSMGCFLCERYYRTEEGIEDSPKKEDQFLTAAAKDLKVKKSFFIQFWDMYRNGMQHQGSPRIAERDGKIFYKWCIHGNYKAIPTLAMRDDINIICIDPWKFADLMIDKFLKKQKNLDKAVKHSFGNIWISETVLESEEVPP
jgi:hypothetical protein